MSEVALLAADAGFEDWRRAARAFLVRGVRPELINWSGEGDLFAGQAPAACDAPIAVSRAFIDLAHLVARHRDPSRFALLYTLLWRLQKERALLALASDTDVFRARRMAKAVSRDQHKMTAFVRFRRVDAEDGEHFIAWYEPDHYIVEATAPFFAERFTSMRWSILTPDKSVHWDGATLAFGAGATRRQAPAEDAAEDDWRAYYAAIFNPARLNLGAMRREMPKRYWRNLPEAPLVAELTNSARARTTDMTKAAPVEARKRAGAAHAALKGDDHLAAIAAREAEPRALKEISSALNGCRACPLWANATQGVPGEGKTHAPLVFVGEQPGDQEDLAGHPFVGPAGKVLNQALEEAGIDRREAFITNAVKHFKNEPRGKRRLHKRPSTDEVQICKWWLDRELELVRPKVIVALGATAMLSLANYRGTLSSVRGKRLEGPNGAILLPTVHPSSLLRMPDEAAKAEGMKHFVADLRAAKRALG